MGYQLNKQIKIKLEEKKISFMICFKSVNLICKRHPLHCTVRNLVHSIHSIHLTNENEEKVVEISKHKTLSKFSMAGLVLFFEKKDIKGMC